MGQIEANSPWTVVVRGHGQSAPGALINALLWDQTYSINKLVHDLRKGLIRHLRRNTKV